jgi:hypothetical protein
VAPLLVAIGAVAVVLGTYLALGGASYEPTPVADPCRMREWRKPSGLQAALEQVALSALDGAACDLGVSREELVLALRDEESLDSFAKKHGISHEEAEQAVRQGLTRSVDDAEAAGVLSGTVAGLVRGVAERIPPGLLLSALERLQSFLP